MFQLPYKKNRMSVPDDLSIRPNGTIVGDVGRTLKEF